MNNAVNVLGQGAINQDIQKSKTVDLLLKPIYDFLYRDGVDEITINQPNEIWLKYGYKWEREEFSFDAKEYEHLVNAICAFNSIKMQANLSVILPKGERCQITHRQAVIEGQMSFNIRKHSTKVYSLDDLNNQGSFVGWRDVSFNKNENPQNEKYISALDPDDLDLMKLKSEGDIVGFLKKIITTEKNIIIAGATGSGKTTFARGLIGEIPKDKRIITIEDVHELHLPNHPNHLHMMFGDGTGRMNATEALKSCMRLSPDRILLAEIRGNEAYEFLNSMNTGHAGGITTVHANSALSCFDRIATLIKNSEVGRSLDLSSIMMSLNTSIDVILFFKQRKLVEVYFDPIRKLQKSLME